MLYVITGVRGAGKTTLVKNLTQRALVTVLQPSTTRAPRFEGEMEYDFVDNWDTTKYAWTIRYGNNFYGMRRSEVDRASHVDAVTVFEPTSIETFYEFRRKEAVISMTIGLDTIMDITEQHARVAESQSRLMSAAQFELARSKVRECDAILAGSEREILVKFEEIVNRNLQ